MHFQSAKKDDKKIDLRSHEILFPMLFSEDKIVLPSPLPFKLHTYRLVHALKSSRTHSESHQDAFHKHEKIAKIDGLLNVYGL